MEGHEITDLIDVEAISLIILRKTAIQRGWEGSSANYEPRNTAEKKGRRGHMRIGPWGAGIWVGTRPK